MRTAADRSIYGPLKKIDLRVSNSDNELFKRAAADRLSPVWPGCAGVSC